MKMILLQLAMYSLYMVTLSATANAQLLNPISNGRFEIGNTQAVPGASTVGKVWTVWPNGAETWGTGVLISENHVLTCGHNLYYKPFGGWAKVVSFGPGWHGQGSPFGVSTANHMRVLTDWLQKGNKNYDIGMFRLRRPLGRQCGWMSIGEWRSDGQYNLNGYDGDVFGGWHQITRKGECRSIFDWPLNDNTRYFAGWYSPAGSSGGPVWRREGNRNIVYGISTDISFTNRGVGVRLQGRILDSIKHYLRYFP